MSDGKITDLLGVKPIGDAVSKVVSSTCDAADAFLSRICLPAAEEFGQLLKDRVHGWRTRNVVDVLGAAESKLGDAPAGTAAHPRLVAKAIEEGSWVDGPELQALWGGLLASSCTQDGLDDSNLLFMNLLSGLTGLQARLLNYACETVPKSRDESGLVAPSGNLRLTTEQLLDVAGTQDLIRVDREVDALCFTGLLDEDSGFKIGQPGSCIATPTALALHLYVRCQGSRLSPLEFFNVEQEVVPLARNIIEPLEVKRRVRVRAKPLGARD